MQHAPPQQTSPSAPFTAVCVILATFLFSILFFLSLSSTSRLPSRSDSRPDPALFPSGSSRISPGPSPPSIAYLISGSSGDSNRILRLLFATYHPRNFYLLHLDLLASQTDRDQLAVAVQSVPVFRAARNVEVIGKADFAYPKGSSPISSTLHGASILLRLSSNWDWFVNLNADDYPLISQDDLLHILSYLPKDLNFMNHTSYIGWRESKRLKPIIVDPGLYLLEKTDMFYGTQKRGLPVAFRLFSGPDFSILSRNFVEHCVLATDNFPRLLLMYLSNTPGSLSNYFPTVLCNSQRFNQTVINHNLLYLTFNGSSREEHHSLTSEEFDAMVESGAAFASGFRLDDHALDRIDSEILGRSPGRVVSGGWCLGEPGNNTCSVWGDSNILRPGPGAERLEKRMVKLLSDDWFRSHQCIVE